MAEKRQRNDNHEREFERILLYQRGWSQE